jgi:signal transduction histidine kinase
LYLLREIGMKSLLCVPIPGRGSVDAVLMLVSESDPHRYDTNDAALARDLAGRAAISLENARLLSEALESVQARDDFLAVAAHELRTPLTSLILQIQILARALDREQRDPTVARRSMGTAETQARRLANLVDGLLDVARLASNRMSIRVEEVDVRQMLSELVTTLAPDLEKAGCSIKVSVPDAIVGKWDRMRIEQVLTNLLSNAMKFGARHPIEVGVTTTSTNVQISVRDHGIGISADDQARIFDRFERAVSSRHFGGLGLGLYISMQILRAHHGSLHVESTPGRGACFIIGVTKSTMRIVEPFIPTPDARHAVTAEGESFIWQAQPGIVVQLASGVLSLPHAHSFIDFYRGILAQGTMIRIFDEFEQLTHHTRDAREFITAFTLEHLFAIDVIHFLLSSKYLALGVSAFKHDIGDHHVCVYSQRASFVRSFEEARHSIDGA